MSYFILSTFPTEFVLFRSIGEEEESEGRAKLLRRVSWADNLIASTSMEDEPTDGNTDSIEKASSTAKIKYRSSRQQSLPVELMAGGSWEGSPEKLSSPSEQVASGAGTPQSPSDLYQMIAEAPIGVPPAKGILKKKSDSSHSDSKCFSKFFSSEWVVVVVFSF